jgi:hypothetical protein
MGIFSPGMGDLVDCPNGSTPAKCLPAEAIFNCGFPGGDVTCGKIPFVKGDRTATIAKWASASIDLSSYVGQDIILDLAFTTVDQGDDIYDTQVLLDNIRFNTAFVDVKSISGVLTVDQAKDRFLKELHGFDDGFRRYGANEVLSQAGLNIQLRGVSLVSDPSPDAQHAVDAPYCGTKPTRPPEVKNLLKPTDRSNVLTDINLYYIGELTGTNVSNAPAITITPEDYNSTDFPNSDLLTKSGLLMAINSGCNFNPPGPRGVVLAHELGHLFMRTTAVTEHKVSGSFTDGISCAGGNSTTFPSVTSTPPTSNQQNLININKIDNPFLTE